MNDNLDDWLNSLKSSESATAMLADTDSVQHVTVPQQLEESSPEPQSLSDQDFDDILTDFGFSPSEDVEAEEIGDSEDNGDEAPFPELAVSQEEIEAALTREFHADMERMREQIQQRDDSNINPIINSDEEVHFHMPNGEVVDVPIVQEQTDTSEEETDSNTEETLIPLNSPTLLLDESTTRFSGAEWYNEIQKQSIIVAGVGGIGSNLVFQLSRMHPAALFMYDDDNVEVVNMAGQLYSRNDIGKSKVAAMYDMITNYTNMQNIYALKQRFTDSTEAGNVMMCGFDNMEARRTFFDAWQRHVFSLPEEKWSQCLFLDGRLSIDTLQVLCVTGDNPYAITEYRDQYLFSDEEAEHTVCSMKQTTYLACMIGSIMVNLFTNWVANQLDPIIPYDLPFFTEYDAQNMIFKTIK